jgi:serine/threonine protein kinase
VALVLQGMAGDHVSVVQGVQLRGPKLYLFFEFMPQTLHDYLNPNSSRPPRAQPIAPRHIPHLLHQILCAVSYCHRCAPPSTPVSSPPP